METLSEKTLTRISATITALLALICLTLWLSHDPTRHFVESVPGMDNQPDKAELMASEEAVSIGEFYTHFGAVVPEMGGEWTQFRGRYSDNIVRENTKLQDSWNENGPDILWSVDLGEGHAAPVVKNGRVYLLDYIEEEKADALRCFSLADGKEIWRRWYKVKVKRNHGMSRTVPAMTNDYIVTIGPRCHVMCVEVESGNFVWGLDLERNYGTTTPFWYTGQCPLIDGDQVIIAPSGTVLIMGVDLTTGEIIWETPNPNNWKMSHVSVMPMTLAGKRMYVYSAVGGMVGVSAEENDRGAVLWETRLWTHSVLAPSPVILPDGRIFLTAGYGAGGMVLKVSENNGSYTVEKLQEYKPKDGMASEQQTPLYYNGHFFSIQPKDAGELREQFVCYNPDDCTRLIWTSDEERFGLGPYIIADEKIFILNDDGVLTMIEASTHQYNQLAQAKILDGHDAWGPLAIVGGKMLLRDSKNLICIELAKK